MNSLSQQQFTRILYENQHIIGKVCSMFCRMEPERSELFQDIMINLWQGLPTFRSDAGISTWIYRVALNTALTRSRRNKMKPAQLTMQIPDNLPAEDGAAAQHIEQKIAALYQGIDKLKDLEKTIILLYLEEKSYAEMAEITGLSEKNISVKLVRIKARLSELIKSILQENE